MDVVKGVYGVIRIQTWDRLRSDGDDLLSCLQYSLYLSNFGKRGASRSNISGGKPIAIWAQSILGVNAVGPLLAFYGIPRRKWEVLFYSSVSNNTRDNFNNDFYISILSWRWMRVKRKTLRTFIQVQSEATCHRAQFNLGSNDAISMLSEVNRRAQTSGDIQWGVALWDSHICVLRHNTTWRPNKVQSSLFKLSFQHSQKKYLYNSTNK
jgi:hypothetical protein